MFSFLSASDKEGQHEVFEALKPSDVVELKKDVDAARPSTPQSCQQILALAEKTSSCMSRCEERIQREMEDQKAVSVSPGGEEAHSSPERKGEKQEREKLGKTKSSVDLFVEERYKKLRGLCASACTQKFVEETGFK
mmetsp:Transcript_24245/g.47649  ORF Transcript_24245/g.47649 Transcript_24245/m.47649 type:complete len:137 (+) Transcript_24245:109-519(+)